MFAIERETRERISGLSAGKGQLEVVRFQLGGLESIQSAYGDLWPAERERVAEVARVFARNRLSKDHFLIPAEGGFVLVMLTGDALSAATLGYSLGQTIDQFFHDDDPDRRFNVDVTHRTLAGEDLPAWLSSIRGIDVGRARRGAISGGVSPNLSHTSFVFQPAWGVKQEAVDLYLAESLNTSTGRLVAGYRFDIGASAERPFVDVDEMSLRVSETALSKLWASGRKAMVGVSLHVSSLLRLSSRARIFKAISELDPILLGGRVIRICGVVPEFPRLYLRDIVQSLAVRVPHVVIGMSPLEDDLGSALKSDPWAISYSISPDADAEITTASIRRAAALTHGAGKRFMVDGHIDRGLAGACADIGVDYISSPVIWAPTSAPSGAYRWRSSRLSDDIWLVDERGEC